MATRKIKKNVVADHLVMVAKILCRKQCNVFNFSVKQSLKRNFCKPADLVQDKYKFLLILDFEATCDSKKIIQEIIEFPCLKINLKNLSEEGRFHQYVKPVQNPVLSNFCIDLTGILQETVDEAKTFPEVYKAFEEWREQEGLTIENSIYITSGDWDLGHMMPRQCALSQLEIPFHMTVWIDIKKLFACSHDIFHRSFSDIMKHYRLDFMGRAHSGIDDCLNMLQVVKEMAKEGFEFKPTTRLRNSKLEIISECLKPKKIKQYKPLSYQRKRKLEVENQSIELSNDEHSSNSSEKVVL